MPEANLPVTYWVIDSEEDMLPVVKNLVQQGYSGTITGAMQASLDADVPPVERWMLSLVNPGGTAVSVETGHVVVWNGFAIQVMPRAVFDSQVGGS